MPTFLPAIYIIMLLHSFFLAIWRQILDLKMLVAFYLLQGRGLLITFDFELVLMILFACASQFLNNMFGQRTLQFLPFPLCLCHRCSFSSYWSKQTADLWIWLHLCKLWGVRFLIWMESDEEAEEISNNIKLAFASDSGEYWCENEEGERSNSVNITVTGIYQLLTKERDFRLFLNAKTSLFILERVCNASKMFWHNSCCLKKKKC